jgi:cellobiose-specific phosphotransferase system component IIA
MSSNAELSRACLVKEIANIGQAIAYVEMALTACEQEGNEETDKELEQAKRSLEKALNSSLSLSRIWTE